MGTAILGALLFCLENGFAQSTPPAFEVASVKRAAPDTAAPGSNNMRGGPGTADPGRITFPSVTLKRLLMAAYSVDVEQIAGPGWLDTERYSVDAKVPAGVTREQLRLMLQSLLLERFHLVLHHERRDFAGYELIVGKRGSRLKPAAPPGGPPPPANVTLPLDSNGFPQAPQGRYATARTEAGATRLGFRAYSMADFVNVLGMPLGGISGNRLAAATVLDKTGLEGKFDFTLEFAGYMGPGGAFPPSPPDAPNGIPNLFDALDTQLGPRLVEKKVQHDVLVIDSIGRLPVEN